MSSGEDLLLTAGAEAWNAWRAQNPSFSPILNGAHLRSRDLRGANLSGTDLRRADLRDANLAGVDLRDALLSHAELAGAILVAAKLSWANLVKATVSKADLSHADLRGADLRFLNGAPSAHFVHADLRGASLSYADIGGSDLTSANLNGAILLGANLEGTNLTSAILLETIFSDANLTGVAGLDSVVHLGPSSVDEKTLAKSGPLPISFLRGCGLSEESINAHHPQYLSAFISFSSNDRSFATALHADLQNKGVRCWFAPRDMALAGDILDAIYGSISAMDRFIVIVSDDSINHSRWVEQEVKIALAEERRRQGGPLILPVRLDNAIDGTKVPWAAFLRDTRNLGNFLKWKEPDGYNESLRWLIEALQRVQAPRDGDRVAWQRR